MWTVDPKIPMSLWWALAVAAAVTIGVYMVRRSWPVTPARRWILALLHGVALLGPLLIALNPTWVETIPPVAGNPMLTVLIDGTLSMQTEDVAGDAGRSRWTRAVDLASRVQPKASTIDVRKLAFGELVKPFHPAQASPDVQARPRGATATTDNRERAESENDALGAGGSEPWPQGHRSDLGTALRQTTRTGSPLGHAILMISDGAHNVGTVESVLQAAREANALATPIYTVTLGTSVGMKNVSLAAKTPRMIAFPKQPVALGASIGHSGMTGQTTQVALMKDDAVLETKTVRLTADPVQEVRFVLEDGIEEPIERFRIVASEVNGEVTTADNQSTVLVQRLSAPIGVLVLEGKPYWDSKFLARNLARDPVVDLSTIVRLAPGRFLQRSVHKAALPETPTSTDTPASSPGSAAAPAADDASEDWSVVKELNSPLESMELLERYRLVILGRDSEAFLTEQGMENLRTWISQSGGCLLCARGAPADQVSSKLAELLPVRWTAGNETRFRAKVTQHGIDSSVFDPLLAEGIDPLGSLPSLAIGSTPKPRPGLPQVLVQSAVDEAEGNVPIVTYQPYGSGQTIVVEGAGMWRWAFLAPQHAAKDKIYPTLWQSMVQWIISQQEIMPGQEVAVRADRATFLNGERASASVMLRDPAKWSRDGRVEGLSALLQSATGELPSRHSLTASGFEGGVERVDLGSLQVGVYTLKIVSGDADEVLAATAFEVRDPWFESLEVDARPDIMNQIARLSGGQTLAPDEVDGLVQKFEQHVKQQQQHAEKRTTMWDRPLVLIAILAAWISTWVVRRQSGLV